MKNHDNSFFNDLMNDLIGGIGFVGIFFGAMIIAAIFARAMGWW